MRVYVAAPYADAPHVRDLHRRLARLGMQPCSSWAESANGNEDLSIGDAEIRAMIARNDADLRSAGAVLVLARAGAGGEMFAEARMALAWEIPVVWVGRRVLSAWREGVRRVSDLDGGLGVLRELAT